mmetsp:Transcript_107849/g.185946  ORF Transcript_107849/g.185946 Transcript_107849/m.185946 type:complete len:526 (-) Transcript_107849:458-2035(-)
METKPPEREEQTIITDDYKWQMELYEMKEMQLLLVAEMHSTWCGPCLAISSALQLMVPLDSLPIPIKLVMGDTDQIVRSTDFKDEGLCSKTQDDCHHSNWLPLLRDLQGGVQPIFLFYRQSTLLAIVEGVNLPEIVRNLRRFTVASFDDVWQCEKPMPRLTRKAMHQAAFKIQTCFRWRRRRRRIGQYIDGTFHTHAEVAALRKEEERRNHLEAIVNKRNGASRAIQRLWRGYLARKWMLLNRKALKLRRAALQAKKRSHDVASRSENREAKAWKRGAKPRPASPQTKTKTHWTSGRTFGSPKGLPPGSPTFGSANRQSTSLPQSPKRAGSGGTFPKAPSSATTEVAPMSPVSPKLRRAKGASSASQSVASVSPASSQASSMDSRKPTDPFSPQQRNRFKDLRLQLNPQMTDSMQGSIQQASPLSMTQPDVTATPLEPSPSSTQGGCSASSSLERSLQSGPSSTDLNSTQRTDLNSTQRTDLGSTQHADLGSTQCTDLSSTQHMDQSSTEPCALNAVQNTLDRSQ